MTFSSLTALLAVWIAAMVSPGPDLVQIIRLGARSRAAGFWAAVGIMTGNTIWIIASLAGLAALIGTYPQILTILQLAGGSYLIHLGISAVRGALAARRGAATAVPEAAGSPVGDGASLSGQPGPVVAWRSGVATNLANPKAVLFFGAVFAQFIRPEMGWGVAVLIAVTMIFTGLVWFISFALAVRAMAARIVRNSVLIDLVTGVVFLGLGAFMAVEGVSGVLAWGG